MSEAGGARRALVTGGSADLGGAICRALAAQGVEVIVHANAGLARAEALADELSGQGGRARAVAFDVAVGPATKPRPRDVDPAIREPWNRLAVDLLVRDHRIRGCDVTYAFLLRLDLRQQEQHASDQKGESTEFLHDDLLRITRRG